VKWLAGVVAFFGLVAAWLSGAFGNKWKKRANDTLDEAEERAIENLSEDALESKQKVLEALDRTRGLDANDRLRLALIRARLRRARDGDS